MAKYTRINVYGFNETGKSLYAAEFLKDKQYIVWSPNPDEKYVHDPEHFKIVYRPKNQFNVEERRRFFHWIMTTKKFHGRGMWVVFDESHNAWPNPPEQRMEEELKQFITSGRHKPYEFNMMFIALTPQELDHNIQRKPLEVICFQVGGDLSRKKLNNWDSGMGDAAVKLKPYQYIHWKMGGSGYEIKEPITPTLI